MDSGSGSIGQFKIYLNLSNLRISEVKDMTISRKSTMKEVVEFLEGKELGEIKQKLEGNVFSTRLLYFLVIGT